MEKRTGEPTLNGASIANHAYSGGAHVHMPDLLIERCGDSVIS
jgi:hypothetical protein